MRRLMLRAERYHNQKGGNRIRVRVRIRIRVRVRVRIRVTDTCPDGRPPAGEVSKPCLHESL